MKKTSKYPNYILVDHLPIVLTGLKNLIHQNKNPDRIDEFTSGNAAIKRLKEIHCDLIIADTLLPDINCIDLLKQTRLLCPDVKILFLTQNYEVRLLKNLIKYNPNGIIPKNSNDLEIIMAINTIFEGHRYYSKKLTENIISKLQSPKANKNPLLCKITKREKQILDLIANERTTKEISGELHLSYYTIETYRKRLISKLNVRGSVGLIVKAKELGLLE
jgi:DNA-binding NarL/FixJ family response regulator